MDGLQPKPWRFTLVIGLWFSYFSLMLFQTFDEYDITFSNKPAANQTFNVIFDFYQLAAMSIVSYVFYKSYLISKNRENKRATFAIFLAAAVYVVAVLYELGESLLSFPDVYGVLTFTLTFIILAYVYIRYPYFVFTVPQKIHRIILATEDGLYLYSAEIEEQDTDTSNELLAGGLAAISKFLAEAVGSRNNLRYSVLGDRVLLVSQLQNVIGFIVADRGARILSSALDHFVYEFVKEYKNEIQNFNAIVTQFDKIESIITRCFPFVEANDIIRQRIS